MNNFEKIKEMSIDEMAKWIAERVSNCEYCSFNCSNLDECEKVNKQWLLKEVESE